MNFVVVGCLGHFSGEVKRKFRSDLKGRNINV